MRKKRKLVCGIGINDYADIVYNGNHMIPSYSHWIDLLFRCYSSKRLNKHKSYIGCSVCDEWLLFSNFKAWFDENYIEGYQLDKDILVKGNKLYCPEDCRYIPQRINSLVINNSSIRGDLPIGVRYNSRCKSKPYVARVTENGKRKHLGVFENHIDAFNYYREYKCNLIKNMAIEAFLNNEIKSDVASALINWNIEISD